MLLLAAAAKEPKLLEHIAGTITGGHLHHHRRRQRAERERAALGGPEGKYETEHPIDRGPDLHPALAILVLLGFAQEKPVRRHRPPLEARDAHHAFVHKQLRFRHDGIAQVERLPGQD